jgi:hypothetical protein
LNEGIVEIDIFMRRIDRKRYGLRHRRMTAFVYQQRKPFSAGEPSANIGQVFDQTLARGLT